MNICNICNGRFSIRINILSQQKTSTIVNMLYFIRDRNEEIWYQPERYNANMNVGEDRWSQNDKIIVR